MKQMATVLKFQPVVHPERSRRVKPVKRQPVHPEAPPECVEGPRRVKRQVAGLEPGIPFVNGYIPLQGHCWKCGSTRIRVMSNGLSYCMECSGPQG